jgi:predicted RNA-binding Zn-ribbon protein involved in translation (DUF1610 family)
MQSGGVVEIAANPHPKMEERTMGNMAVGFCVNCGEGHHLVNGLCWDCRGQETAMKCSKCGIEIPGEDLTQHPIFSDYLDWAPRYCDRCYEIKFRLMEGERKIVLMASSSGLWDEQNDPDMKTVLTPGGPNDIHWGLTRRKNIIESIESELGLEHHEVRIMGEKEESPLKTTRDWWEIT